MAMGKILDEPLGSKISIMEVMMYNKWKHKGIGDDDILYIVYKNEDGKKKVKAIKNPPFDIYFTKPEYRGQWNTPREYIEMDKVYSVTTTSRKVLSTIYQTMKEADDPSAIALKKIYNQAAATGNHSAKKEIFKWPHVFMADLDVQDYYRIMLGYQYDLMHGHTIDKCFLDIESDIYGLSSTEQNMNMDPTNACTLIFNFDDAGIKKQKKKVFTYLLRNHKRYPQQKYFEEHLDEFIKQCHDEFDEQVVEKDGKKRKFDTRADYCIRLFDSEMELNAAIFETINYYKPDTCEIWNIAYDLPKLRARQELNGHDPCDIMCDPAFPKMARFVEMNIDNRAEIDIADRKTYIKMASTTKWIDQMQAYANIRKGRKAYGSNKLDNIAKIELGMGKREFKKGIDVTNAAIKDYWNFVLYNITDVWRQALIDIVTNDAMALVYDSNQSNCAIENLAKQTRYQKQIYYTWRLRKGFISGCNPNNDYIRGRTEDYAEYIADLKAKRKLREDIDDASDNSTDDPEDDLDPDEYTLYNDKIAELTDSVMDVYSDSVDRKIRLQGGLVGDPDLNSANGTELVEGVPSKHIFDDQMDMDYASEYPWAKFTRSLSMSTQIGRLIIGEKISDRQNSLPGIEKPADHIKHYIPGAEFTADYISQDIMSMGNVWFNLPTFEDVLKYIDNKS